MRAKDGLIFATLVTLAVGSCGCASEDQPAFTLELSMTADGPGTDVGYVVNGESSSRVWSASFASLDRACQTLEEEPIVVECRRAGGDSCGMVEVAGVCCWAPRILKSPVVKGEFYVGFRDQQGPLVEEGHCTAQDGTSTHGDSVPDAGPG